MQDQTRIEQVLSRYGRPFCDGVVERLSEAVGFSGAGVFRVACPEGDFCLRQWPANALPRERILILHRLLRTIHEAGVDQVAVPVRSMNGTTVVDSGGLFWQLEPWMPGRADFHEQPTRERLTSAMNCLAEWHLAASRFEPTRDEEAWFSVHPGACSPAVDERLSRLRGWSSQLLDRLENALRQENSSSFAEPGRRIVTLFRLAAPHLEVDLDACRTSLVPLHPCLRDVWHDHVLFTGNAVTGLVDPSACRTENVASDLSRLLGSLVGDDVEAWGFAIEQYATCRPLSHDERRLVRTLDRSGVALSGMNWLDRLFLQHQPIEHPERVLKRLHTFLRRFENLVERL